MGGVLQSKPASLCQRFSAPRPAVISKDFVGHDERMHIVCVHFKPRDWQNIPQRCILLHTVHIVSGHKDRYRIRNPRAERQRVGENTT